MLLTKQVFTTVLLLLCLATHAQIKPLGSITAIVKDDKTVLEGASVFLYKVKDSVLVKSTFSSSDGSFIFENLVPQLYFITISYAGKTKYHSANVDITNTQLNLQLPIIVLNSNTNNLDEIQVTTKKNFVERKIDRILVNPDALISNAGSTALEVLEKSPGIQVNTDGVISLRGRQGVIVFIDDKPTNMNEADVAAYLRSLPSSSIDVIEIMSNPPAKYDAAGSAGVINIKLKKIKAKGFNGGFSLAYGQGVYARTNNSFNFNYRINKVNFFSNISYTKTNVFQDLFLHREYYNTSGSLASAFNQNSFIKKHPGSLNLKLGVDYYINNKETFGLVFTGFQNETTETVDNTAQILDGSMAVKNRVVAYAPTTRNWYNRGINTNYTYAFNAGKQLMLNADYIYYNSTQNNSLLNTVYKPNGSLDNQTNLISTLPATINIASAKADYNQPINKESKFEIGAKTSFIDTKNTASFFDEVSGTLTPNYEFSNSFNYKENINAAYVNYTYEKGRFALQAGLRFENTNLKGYQYGNPTKTDSSFTRVFNNLFPTFYLQYTLDTLSKHQLALSLGRRISRPDYQSMNPFTYPLDRYTLYSGNPYLQPTFSYNTQLSYTYKNNFTVSFGYSYTKDVINETIKQENNIFYSRPGNIGRQISYDLQVNGTLAVAKWWKLQLYASATHNEFDAQLYNQQLNNAGTFYVINPVNLFQISKQWSAELAGVYQTSIYSGQFVLIPVGQVRMAVGKKVLKDKGNIKLNLTDAFYTQQPGGDIKSLANSTAGWKSYLDTRILSCTFSYRFNKGKSLKARDTKSADEEKGRVK
jgi:iron complex outermembrane recepter protein